MGLPATTAARTGPTAYPGGAGRPGGGGDRGGVPRAQTSHPPNYYLPPEDIRPGVLARSRGRSLCEWKGQAHYFDVRAGTRLEQDAAWGYDTPTRAFAAIAGYVAFYPGRMDACFVDDERVLPQPGGFYGGWITANLVGPFKGGPGSQGW